VNALILEIIVIGRQHSYRTCSCHRTACHICDGGLSMCSVCMGAEGSLTAECPGRPITADEERRIYDEGTLDFRRGRWVNAPNYPRCARVEKE
jgi:hypothetical protein